MKVLCLMLLTAMGCASTQRAGTAAKTAAEICGKQYAPAIAAEAASYGVRSLIAGKVDWATVEVLAKGAGLQVGGCAAIAFVRAWKDLQPVGVAALGGEADTVTQGQAMLARLGAHWGVEMAQ